MKEITKTLQGFVADFGLKVIGVIVLLVIAWIVAGWMKKLVARVVEKRGLDKSLGSFLGSRVRWTIIVLAIIAALGIFGVQTTSFAAVIGAAGLAIGLAMQGSLANLAAGVMLLIFRPFKADDVVSVAGETGKVNEISLFSTTMDTVQNRRIIVPNRQIFGSVIKNLTFHDIVRADVPVGVDYGASVDETRKILEAVPAKVEGALTDPAPAVVLTNLGDSALDWQVRVWCKTEDYFAVLEKATRATKLALDEAGISIPYPQVDVHLDK